MTTPKAPTSLVYWRSQGRLHSAEFVEPPHDRAFFAREMPSAQRAKACADAYESGFAAGPSGGIPRATEDTTKPRLVLVHLNVEVAPTDTRTADEVAAYLDDALSIGMEGHDGGEPLTVVVALAEEV